MPSWAGVNLDAFMAGFGICEEVMALLFVFLIGFFMLKKLLQVAGLL